MRSSSRFFQCVVLLVMATILASACAKPVAKFSSDSFDKSSEATIKFANQSTKAESYFWDFGDGNTSTETNPSHRYASSGNYLVTLQASSKDKVATDSQRVQLVAPTACMVEISTSYGNVLLSLSDKTPLHRDNFFKLVEEEFYNGLIFHRIIDGFVVQGGDPTGIGTGGPDYQIPAEFDQGLAHVRGALAAARTPDEENPERMSSGSQFYVVSGRPVTNVELDKMQVRKGISYSSEIRKAYLAKGGLPILDANYTVFGQVVEGMDVIDALSRVATDELNRPKEELNMQIRVIN